MLHLQDEGMAVVDYKSTNKVKACTLQICVYVTIYVHPEPFERHVSRTYCLDNNQ